MKNRRLEKSQSFTSVGCWWWERPWMGCPDCPPGHTSRHTWPGRRASSWVPPPPSGSSGTGRTSSWPPSLSHWGKASKKQIFQSLNSPLSLFFLTLPWSSLSWRPAQCGGWCCGWCYMRSIGPWGTPSATSGAPVWATPPPPPAAPWEGSRRGSRGGDTPYPGSRGSHRRGDCQCSHSSLSARDCVLKVDHCPPTLLYRDSTYVGGLSRSLSQAAVLHCSNFTESTNCWAAEHWPLDSRSGEAKLGRFVSIWLLAELASLEVRRRRRRMTGWGDMLYWQSPLNASFPHLVPHLRPARGCPRTAWETHSQVSHRINTTSTSSLPTNRLLINFRTSDLSRLWL